MNRCARPKLFIRWGRIHLSSGLGVCSIELCCKKKFKILDCRGPVKGGLESGSSHGALS